MIRFRLLQGSCPTEVTSMRNATGSFACACAIGLWFAGCGNGDDPSGDPGTGDLPDGMVHEVVHRDDLVIVP